MSFSINRLDQWPIVIPSCTRTSSGTMSFEDKIALEEMCATDQVIDEFDLAAPQTIFHTSKTPMSTPLFVVNGQLQRLNLDFSVLGTTVQWVSADFPLTAGDTVQMVYQGM